MHIKIVAFTCKTFRLCLLILLLLAAGLPATEYIVDGGGGGDYTTIQAALDVAGAGDIITVKNGTYTENLVPPTGGTGSTDTVTLRAENRRQAILLRAAAGNAISIDVPWFRVEGLLVDGDWLSGHVIRIQPNGHNSVISDCEVVRTTGGDLVNILNGDNCIIEDCDIYYGLAGTFAAQDDSHGICLYDNVTNTIIRRCNIRYTSGDSFQADPTRQDCNLIYIEECILWTGALPAGPSYPAGWSAGHRPGENAVDLKQRNDGLRMQIFISDCEVYGWRDTNISNVAAFNFKNKSRAIVDRCKVYDSEIAFRLRGTGTYDSTSPKIRNCFIYDNDYGVRFEDDVEDVTLANNTFDNNILDLTTEDNLATTPENHYHEGSYKAYNNLFIGTLPSFGVSDPSNVAISTGDASTYLVDRAGGDYHLTFSATSLIDTGVDTVPLTSYDYTDDIDGETRPIGGGWDIGADEFDPAGSPPAFQVIYPNGGQNFTGGTDIAITWNSQNFIGTVKLEFYNGTSWSSIIGVTPNDGSHTWEVTDADLTGCLIRVSDSDDGDPADSSDNPFTVTFSNDIDDDGMDDTWEANNGLNVGLDDADLDADGDDYTNLQEYLGDSDPQDPLDVPATGASSTEGSSGCLPGAGGGWLLLGLMAGLILRKKHWKQAEPL